MISLQELISEEQDPKVIEKVLPKVKEFCTANERIEYIAVQKKTIGINFSPDCIVLTDRRVILVRPKSFGFTLDFTDYPWIQIADVHLREGVFGAEITIKTIQGRIDKMEDIPKAQARKLYRYAQEMEEIKKEERRARELEDKRAAAGGGIVINSPANQPSTISPITAQFEDPFEALAKLKRMVEASLISQEEYDVKKEQVLARI